MERAIALSSIEFCMYVQDFQATDVVIVHVLTLCERSLNVVECYCFST